MRLLKRLFSKEDRFFHLLEASADEGCASVKALRQVLDPAATKDSLATVFQARDRERQIRNEIDVLLCEGEPAPLAPEDLEGLNRALYRVPKGIKKFAERYVICASRLRQVSFEQQLAMLETAVETLHQMVVELTKGSNLTAAKTHNLALQKIEGEADKLLVTTLDELYRGKYDLVTAVMLKDLYELLERVFDRCRNAGNILMQIALKRS